MLPLNPGANGIGPRPMVSTGNLFIPPPGAMPMSSVPVYPTLMPPLDPQHGYPPFPPSSNQSIFMPGNLSHSHPLVPPPPTAAVNNINGMPGNFATEFRPNQVVYPSQNLTGIDRSSSISSTLLPIERGVNHYQVPTELAKGVEGGPASSNSNLFGPREALLQPLENESAASLKQKLDDIGHSIIQYELEHTKWLAGFSQWKKDNESHPDQTQFVSCQQQYENAMSSQKQLLMEQQKQIGLRYKTQLLKEAGHLGSDPATLLQAISNAPFPNSSLPPATPQQIHQAPQHQSFIDKALSAGKVFPAQSMLVDPSRSLAASTLGDQPAPSAPSSTYCGYEKYAAGLSGQGVLSSTPLGMGRPSWDCHVAGYGSQHCPSGLGTNIVQVSDELPRAINDSVAVGSNQRTPEVAWVPAWGNYPAVDSRSSGLIESQTVPEATRVRPGPPSDPHDRLRSSSCNWDVSRTPTDHPSLRGPMEAPVNQNPVDIGLQQCPVSIGGERPLMGGASGALNSSQSWLPHPLPGGDLHTQRSPRVPWQGPTGTNAAGSHVSDPFQSDSQPESQHHYHKVACLLPPHEPNFGSRAYDSEVNQPPDRFGNKVVDSIHVSEVHRSGVQYKNDTSVVDHKEVVNCFRPRSPVDDYDPYRPVANTDVTHQPTAVVEPVGFPAAATQAGKLHPSSQHARGPSTVGSDPHGSLAPVFGIRSPSIPGDSWAGGEQPSLIDQPDFTVFGTQSKPVSLFGKPSDLELHPSGPQGGRPGVTYPSHIPFSVSGEICRPRMPPGDVLHAEQVWRPTRPAADSKHPFDQQFVGRPETSPVRYSIPGGFPRGESPSSNLHVPGKIPSVRMPPPVHPHSESRVDPLVVPLGQLHWSNVCREPVQDPMPGPVVHNIPGHHVAGHGVDPLLDAEYERRKREILGTTAPRVDVPIDPVKRAQELRVLLDPVVTSSSSTEPERIPLPGIITTRGFPSTTVPGSKVPSENLVPMPTLSLECTTDQKPTSDLAEEKSALPSVIDYAHHSRSSGPADHTVLVFKDPKRFLKEVCSIEYNHMPLNARSRHSDRSPKRLRQNEPEHQSRAHSGHLESQKETSWDRSPTKRHRRAPSPVTTRRTASPSQTSHTPLQFYPSCDPKKELESSGKDILKSHPPLPSGVVSSVRSDPIKREIIPIQDILESPGRDNRPKRIVVILRGPPGVGKSRMAKLIKDKEVQAGSSAVRILSLDDYFLAEVEGPSGTSRKMEYLYEADMEEVYRASLTKAFIKTLEDGFFHFVIVDAVNSKFKEYEKMWSAAMHKGFEVYVAELMESADVCAERNVHERTREDIQQIINGWEEVPKHLKILDLIWMLQEGAISEVEMEDVVDSGPIVPNESDSADEDESAAEGSFHLPKSRWDDGDSLAVLDGLRSRKKQVKEVLSRKQAYDDVEEDDPYDEKEADMRVGKKRVRWADIEERRLADHRRKIGFCIGADWSLLTDSSAEVPK